MGAWRGVWGLRFKVGAGCAGQMCADAHSSKAALPPKKGRRPSPVGASYLPAVGARFGDCARSGSARCLGCPMWWTEQDRRTVEAAMDVGEKQGDVGGDMAPGGFGAPVQSAPDALPCGALWPYGAAAWERLVRRATALLGAPCGPVAWSPDPEGVSRVTVWRSPEGIVRVGWVGDVCVSLSWDGESLVAPDGAAPIGGWPERWSVGWSTGTPWARSVWGVVLASPGTLSYGGVAKALGRPGASRAVGRALGANPLAPLVPCHLPVRGDGGLGGFRWCVVRKACWRDQEGL